MGIDDAVRLLIQDTVHQWFEDQQCPEGHDVCEAGCLVSRLTTLVTELLDKKSKEHPWGWHICIDHTLRPWAGIFCHDSTCWPRGVTPTNPEYKGLFQKESEP